MKLFGDTRCLAAISLALALLTAGCGTMPSRIQKKFTRKNKESKVAPVMYLEDGYQKKYSNEYYYKTHFTYWRTWQDEWIGEIGGNQKRLRRSAQEAVNHLKEMHRYLMPEKQEELQSWINSSERLSARVQSGGYSSSDESSVRMELEKIYRIVSGNFYYDKVKDFVAPDKVDLEA